MCYHFSLQKSVLLFFNVAASTKNYVIHSLIMLMIMWEHLKALANKMDSSSSTTIQEHDFLGYLKHCICIPKRFVTWLVAVHHFKWCIFYSHATLLLRSVVPSGDGVLFYVKFEFSLMYVWITGLHSFFYAHCLIQMQQKEKSMLLTQVKTLFNNGNILFIE